MLKILFLRSIDIVYRSIEEIALWWAGSVLVAQSSWVIRVDQILVFSTALVGPLSLCHTTYVELTKDGTFFVPVFFVFLSC